MVWRWGWLRIYVLCGGGVYDGGKERIGCDIICSMTVIWCLCVSLFCVSVLCVIAAEDDMCVMCDILCTDQLP